MDRMNVIAVRVLLCASFMLSAFVAHASAPQALTYRNLKAANARVDERGIRRVFAQNSPRMRSCYQRHLNPKNKQEGKVVVSLRIGKTGRLATKPRIVWRKTTLTDSKVIRCIIGHLKRYRFPAHNLRHDIKLDYPMEFSARWTRRRLVRR